MMDGKKGKGQKGKKGGKESKFLKARLFASTCMRNGDSLKKSCSETDGGQVGQSGATWRSQAKTLQKKMAAKGGAVLGGHRENM